MYNETFPGKPFDLPIGTDSRNAEIINAILAGTVMNLEYDDADEESDLERKSDNKLDTELDDDLDDDEDDDKDNMIHPSFDVASTTSSTSNGYNILLL